MSIVRALDATGDWTFGKGKNNYLSGNAAIGQAIKCRLSEFLGDCFFSTSSGIDWFNLLGSKNQTALQLAINAVILNTSGVTGILQISYNLSPTTRAVNVAYAVQTVYGNTNQIFQYNFN